MGIANLVILLGAVHGVFFSLVLMGLPSPNRSANHWLALFLAQFSISMVGTVIYNNRLVLDFPHLGLVYSPFSVVAGPTFFLFIRSLTQKKYRFGGWGWAHFLPFLVAISWILPFYGLSAVEKRAILEASYQTEPTAWKRLFQFSNLVNFVYVILTIVLLLRHRRAIKNVFSNTTDKSLDWVQNFTFSGVAIFFICVFCSQFNSAFADTVSNVIFSILIYVMGYRALRQPEIFTGLRDETLAETVATPLLPLPDKYQKSGLSEEKAAVLLARLDRLTTVEKIYLDPELTLQHLADRLETTPHAVSQLLNQYKKVSFFDFINGLRVEHFKAAVNEPSNAHLSILGVAFDSGFNSKAAFNAVFKRMTNQTPSEFRRGPTN